MSSSSLTKGSLSASNGAPLPNLNGDLRQAVFTHRSVRLPTPNEHWGDNTRLAVLGEEIMRLVVTWCLFEKRPMMSAQEISSAREEFLSSANIDAWANAYRMKQNLLISVDMVPSLQMPEVSIYSLKHQIVADTVQESRTLFASFVGAVYYQHGLVECNKWIGSLLDPTVEPPAPPGAPAQPIKIEQSIWPNPAAIQSYPPQPTATPPPVPASDAGTSTMETGSEPSLGGSLPIPPPYSNPASTAIPGPTFLPLVNQTANQRRMTIDYPSQFAGPAHAGQWQVRCTSMSHPFHVR
jgi:dsRNA-specific ribonuclease